ncbi:MAG: hypothetical protein JKY89_12265 [Immundisolibacteraceae bacterium]|nr:hypothetical protein [Immundisolibacteraceae bacterium]
MGFNYKRFFKRAFKKVVVPVAKVFIEDFVPVKIKHAGQEIECKADPLVAKTMDTLIDSKNYFKAEMEKYKELSSLYEDFIQSNCTEEQIEKLAG